MDPFSYGYNRATPTYGYMNASGIVTSLIDIVSKNGNFLLDVGPQPNGTIIDVEQTHLRQGGVWIKDHAEAIFNTTYWFITPEEGSQIRFTQTLDAFYIMTLSQPNETIVLNSPVPWVEGDQVTVVGGNASGTVVPSQMLSNGSVLLNISSQVQQADQYAWIFKISYDGVAATNTTSGGNATATSTSGPASVTVSRAAAMQHGELFWLSILVVVMLLL
jgi:alpha-L-fucosidase